jgi:cellulose synthase/poly-beta-1,6-N-acetylglucosamine synthase-like glycosyltransferase
MSCWNRPEFTAEAISLIEQRTAIGTYSLHCYDNGSSQVTRDLLYSYLISGKITSLVLDSRNTGCLYNKLVYHAMVETKDKYYCVTDNDVLPPKLTPDWLSQMLVIMENHPEIALLTPQIPPQFLQMPYLVTEDVVYANAVGNTFKLLRREAVAPIIHRIEQKLGAYGDDGLLSSLLQENNWKIAFCRNIFALHKGQCENWGYTPEQVSLDPRKQGYGTPFTYPIKNWDTYEPADRHRM